jgi:pimeloyl-ACP methyl ester carboxylesterase
MMSKPLAASLAILAGAAVGLGGCAAWVDSRASSREAAAEARYPATGRFVEVEGVRVHAHVEGSGPDVVLIHGANGNLRDMTFRLSGELARDFRVIAFDRPGLGWSDPLPGGGASPLQQAALLRAAARELGVRRAVVVGHSYGGAVALAWGLQAPEETAALVVLAGASHPWRGPLSLTQTFPGTALGAATVVPIVTAFATQGQIEGALENVFAPQPVPEGFAEHMGLGLVLRRASIVESSRQVSALKSHLQAMAPRYPLLPMPVEIVHGTADRTVGFDIHGARLAADVPGAGMTRLEGVGHMPHHTNLDETLAAIRRAAERAGLR